MGVPRRARPYPPAQATPFKRPHGVRHMFAAYDLRADQLYGHIKPRKRGGEFLAFLRYVRSLHPESKRLAIIPDNFSSHQN